MAKHPKTAKRDVPDLRDRMYEPALIRLADSMDANVDPAEILDQVAASLEEWAEVRVEIAGHTDATGDEAFNRELSQNRAKSIRAYLMQRGIDGSRMTARGYGESRPVGNNATSAGRRQNRRVELVRLD